MKILLEVDENTVTPEVAGEAIKEFIGYLKKKGLESSCNFNMGAKDFIVPYRYLIDMRLAGKVHRAWFEDLPTARIYLAIVAGSMAAQAAAIFDTETHKLISQFPGEGTV